MSVVYVKALNASNHVLGLVDLRVLLTTFDAFEHHGPPKQSGRVVVHKANHIFGLTLSVSKVPVLHPSSVFLSSAGVMSATSAPERTLLVVIVDVNSHNWGQVPHKVTFDNMLQHLMFCLNAHLQLNAANTLALIASDHNRSEIVFPCDSFMPNNDHVLYFDDVKDAVLQQLHAFVESSSLAGDTLII